MDPTIRTRVLGGAAALAAVAVVLVLLNALGTDGRDEEAPPPPRLGLLDPKGVLTAPPTAFRWEPFTGAAIYRLTVADQDTVWPLVRREVEATSVALEPREIAALSPPRKYSWTVEACSSDGRTVLAAGKGYFAIQPAGEATGAGAD